MPYKDPKKRKAHQRAYNKAHRKEAKAYRKAHRKEAKAYRKAHRKEAKAYNKAYYKAYYKAHHKEKKAYNKAYRKAYRKEIAARGKAYRKAYRKEIAAKKKAYNKAYRKEIAARGKAYRKAHHKEKKVYSRTMGPRHTHLLRRSKALKRRGCTGTPMSLRKHQEKLYFKDGRERRCHYCGGENNKTGSGLDRLDNNVVYTFKNTVPCCWGCNVWRSVNHTVWATLKHFKPMRDAARLARKPS